MHAERDALVIRAADDDRALVEPTPVRDPRDAAAAVLGALETIARARRIAELRNTEPGSRLQGNIRLVVRRYDPRLAPAEMPIVELIDGERALVYDPALDANLYLLEVQNHGPRPVFVTAFTLNADHSVTRLYPLEGVEQSIDPDRALYIGHDHPDELIDVWLPGDEPGEPRWTVSRNTFKVFASVTPTDLSLLEQGGLDVPVPEAHRVTTGLEGLVAATVQGKRMARRRRDRVEDWATAELPFTVVRRPTEAALTPGRTTADGVTFDAPPGFTARARVDTVGQATRGGRAAPLPPGLARDPDLRAVGRTGSRGTTDDALAIHLTLDGALDPDRPLHIELPTRGALWPVVYDGQDHLIAGHPAGDGRVAITTLPADPADPAHAEHPGQRGARRTLTLFFLERTGRPSPQLGLHRLTLDGNTPTYHPLAPGDITPGQRALLIVHGFGSGTLGPARALAPALGGYDHLLTFDYESLGTPIDTHAAALAAALRKAGFGPDDGRTLHVVAHSMGGLVARAALELHGAAACTDRLAMTGTPNGGTRLLDALDGARFLADIALNTFAGPALALPLGVLVDQLARAAEGPADVRPDSPLLRALATPRPDPTPYLLIAGRGGLAASANRLKRLAAKAAGVALDHLFGQPHDLVVGHSDMRAIQSGQHPALTVRETDSNHFDYLRDADTLAALAALFGARAGA
ncbi:MAG: hypothetical protein R3F65_18030 [bacterium]